MRRALQVTLLLAMVSCSLSASFGDGIAVDAAHAVGDISSRLFGQNISWGREQNYPPETHTPARDLWSWNVYTTAPVWEPRQKYTTIPIVRSATGQNALIRFAAADGYHWRRGVGWPLEKRDGQGQIIQGNRPYHAIPNSTASYGSEFGIDEMMDYVTRIRQEVTGVEPLVIINWWDWNNPVATLPDGVTRDEFVARGVQEAANFVEYCNREVTQAILDDAEDGAWEPTKFMKGDAPPVESTDADAEETPTYNEQEERSSWLSWEDAPDGYFAWLRYYFAQQRGVSDPGPYNIHYWHIGNEIAWKYADSYHQYDQNSLKGWAEDYSNGDGTGEPAGVSLYATAMRAASPIAIKIGAMLHDAGNYRIWQTDHWELTDQPGPGAYSGTYVDWDTAVINLAGPYIDFLTLHPYIGLGIDQRYSLNAKWESNSEPPSDGTMTYQAKTLTAGTYTFWVRAKGSPSGGVYPKMRLYLIPCSGNCTAPSTSTDHTWESIEQEVDYVEDDQQAFTRIVENGQNVTNHDYRFVVTISNTLDYVPWVKLTNSGPNIEVRAIYYLPGEVQNNVFPTGATPMEIRQANDQTRAVFAAPTILGRRVASIKEYVTDAFPTRDIEIGFSEYAYCWALTAYPDQICNLGGTP